LNRTDNSVPFFRYQVFSVMSQHPSKDLKAPTLEGHSTHLIQYFGEKENIFGEKFLKFRQNSKQLISNELAKGV